jgi:lipopolysaccharide export system permease protein
MRLLDRYLFRELLTSLAYCLGGFLVFWTSYDLFNELAEMQERKLHLLDVLAYVAARTPEFVVTALPITLLLALLYTLAQHARHNEITAMRAAGVSLWRVGAPYYLAGLAAGAALFGINEYCVPPCSAWADRIMNRYVQKQDETEAQNHLTYYDDYQDQRLWHFQRFQAKPPRMIAPNVNWPLPDGSRRWLKAGQATYTNGIWVFWNAQEYEQATPEATMVPLHETNLVALPMPQFRETPKQIESEGQFSKYRDLHGTRQPDIPLSVILNYLRLHPNVARSDDFWLFCGHPQPEFKDSAFWLTKLHGRLAEPWTCLVVVFIAIPFGAVTGRRSLFAGVAGSIFICFGYFVIQLVSLALGYGGYLVPWLAAWLPNLVFGMTGLWLMARVR